MTTRADPATRGRRRALTLQPEDDDAQALALCDALPRWQDALTSLSLLSLRVAPEGLDALIKTLAASSARVRNLSLQGTTLLGAEVSLPAFRVSRFGVSGFRDFGVGVLGVSGVLGFGFSGFGVLGFGSRVSGLGFRVLV